MYDLRPYQKEAVSKMLWSLTLEGNDVVCIGQGGGKSIIIASFAHKLQKPVLILCPSKEILEQDIEKMSQYISKDKIGIYSASLSEKTIKNITFGTIQSVYKNPELFKGFDVVIFDEADLHNPKNVEGMSSKLFRGAGIRKVFGLTGTPYRQDIIYERWGKLSWQVTTITTLKIITRYRSRFWNRMLCVVNIADLQEKGFLTKLTYKNMELVRHEDIPTNKSKSEFDLEKFESMVCNRYTDVASFIQKLPHKRVLVFCSSVDQANALKTHLNSAEVVTALSSSKMRSKTIQDFKSGRLKVLLGVGIFTMGFDVPELDAIVVLRPTKSLRLWSQVLGRGTRIHKDKTGCTVYDFVDNTKNLGTLESIKVCKLDGKWDVVSDARPGGFHYQPLFSYRLTDPNKRRFIKRSLTDTQDF